MDTKDLKYDIVLDIIEHPEKYSSTQLEEILSDQETRDIYNLLCKSESAIEADKDVDVNAEWEKFAIKHNARQRRSFLWRGSRAASIAIIALTSIAAIAAGIAITETFKNHDPKPAAEEISNSKAISSTGSKESVTEPQDTVVAITKPVMFEDDSLEDIMKVISSIYEVEIIFNNKEAATLHLYYRLDPSQPLDEVISQLNTFEQIHINRDGAKLTID